VAATPGRFPQQRILQEASEAELATAVEENLFALFRAMTVLRGSELVEDEGLSYHLAFPSNPMFKGVWRTRLAPGQAHDAIKRTIAWFKARNAPFFFWWTGPGTAPADLDEHLVAHGLLSMEEQARQTAPGIRSTTLGAPGMVADLQRMNEAALAQTPPGFTIEEVRDRASLSAFKQVLVESYEMPEGMAHGWVQAAMRVGVGRTPWQLYLGRLDGRPVATHILFKGAGVAGVYGVATVPDARHQGLGGAITLQPLLDARADGYRYAVLFSTEIGIRAYERIGFRTCGARINRYLWRTTSA
jgi:ribosomal protein S18 acetylase RimI-like enzyme